MAMSGIAVSDDILTNFAKMKNEKKNPYKYIMMKISDDNKLVEIEKTGGKPTPAEQKTGDKPTHAEQKTGDKPTPEEELSPEEEEAYFKTFLDLLQDDQPRYIVYDFKHTTEEKRRITKLVFISWSPDKASIKKKMLFASTKDALKKKFTGIQTFIQASDKSDLDYKETVQNLAK